MGKLIKNHWARLIVLTAATCTFAWGCPWTGGKRRQFADILTTDQVAAGLEGFFWPKIFWDWLTKTLDPAVKPLPILQIINVAFGLVMLAWEWPIGFLAGSSFHRSLEARLAALPLTALAAILIYQGTNAALYYVVALAVYFWAYSEGEVSDAQGTLPDDLLETNTLSFRSSAQSLGLYLNGAVPVAHVFNIPTASATFTYPHLSPARLPILGSMTETVHITKLSNRFCF